jgi:hypothetical protein
MANLGVGADALLARSNGLELPRLNLAEPGTLSLAAISRVMGAHSRHVVA